MSHCLTEAFILPRRWLKRGLLFSLKPNSLAILSTASLFIFFTLRRFIVSLTFAKSNSYSFTFFAILMVFFSEHKKMWNNKIIDLMIFFSSFHCPNDFVMLGFSGNLLRLISTNSQHKMMFGFSSKVRRLLPTNAQNEMMLLLLLLTLHTSYTSLRCSRDRARTYSAPKLNWTTFEVHTNVLDIEYWRIYSDVF